MCWTCWYQSPSPLKLMIDRLVCADGGNPDPTTNHGKRVAGDKAVQEEACNVARPVVQAIVALRSGHLSQPDKQIKWPRPK